MGLDLEQPSAEFHMATEENWADASVKTQDADVELLHSKGRASVSAWLSIHGKENTGRISNSRHRSFDGDGMITRKELEPHDGMEFESKEGAFSFYKQYAKSIGFAAIIKASHRSRISGKFINAKFVCTRYGNKQECTVSETPNSLPNADNITSNIPVKRRRGRIKRSSLKTDCKACMHVKRNEDGRWIVHNFIKQHNHEIFPDQARCFQGHRNMDLANGNVDESKAARFRTKKTYMTMSKQFGVSKKLENKKDDYTDAGGPYLALEEGDAQAMLEYFLCMQDENPNFFYAIDLNQEQRLRNVFWVGAKGRLDYAYFSDVVFLDTHYVKNEYKLPFVPFIGVNHHFQFLFLGCSLIGDESKSSYVWLMQAWLRAMGGEAPRVILTDQDETLKSAITEVFKDSRHCFCLWHIMSKIQEKLGYVIRQHENFITKFNKCILKSTAEEQFEKRWWKLVDRFNLRNDLWIQSIHKDRSQWVPAYLKGILLAGMSALQRLENISSLCNKYMQRKTTLREFLDQYKIMLKEKYEDEAKADFETWHKQPGLKSPSPFEKQMKTLYTHAIFKKFQVEVLGVVACYPKKEGEDGSNTTFKVQDLEQDQDFIVLRNDKTSDTSCSCRLFEFNGFLCRHVMIVLQMSGVHKIPSKYILKRWTKDAKSREAMREVGLAESRVERYTDICMRALKLGDEGSLSLESYNIAFSALEEALRKCESMNNSIQYVEEPATTSDHILHEFEEVRMTGRNNVSDKEKARSEQEVATIGVHSSWQQMGHANFQASAISCSYGLQDSIQGMEQLNSRVPAADSYFGFQQFARGGKLNTTALTRDNYYSTQPTIYGLGQLNLIATIQDTQYDTQQRLHRLGQLQFRPQSIQNCFSIRDSLQDVDQSNLGNTEIRGMASKHLRL